MRFLFRISLFILLPLWLLLNAVSCQTKSDGKVALDISQQPLKNLSEYHFFKGSINELKPNKGLIPYDLISPLFTDYAFKARFVYVPEGQSIDFDTSEVLQFPIGTCLIKNFYYPEDFNKPEGKRRIIETRLLVHRESGWENLGYIWNDEQTDATLEVAGVIKAVKWKHYDGSVRTVDYVAPNKNQCKGCHWRNEKNAISPIGPKASNLNKDFTYAEGTMNQLAYWQKVGILKNFTSPETSPRLADWTDSISYNINDRARAYLDINCAHCHNPNGPAYTTGLHLNIDNTNPENLGICKSPVAAGKATGGFLCDIVPGHPGLSILTYRMASEDPGIKMPEVGKVLVHKEGLALISQWIAEMEENDCKVK